MKLKIGYFNVDVTATEDVSCEDKTLQFINELSIAFGYAAAYSKANDMPAHYDHYYKLDNDTYNFLKNIGYYGKEVE